jgi:hypothetical protein
MTVKDLIKRLNNYHEDKIVIIKEKSGGWCNIEAVENESVTVNLIMEGESLFSKS